MDFLKPGLMYRLHRIELLLKESSNNPNSVITEEDISAMTQAVSFIEDNYPGGPGTKKSRMDSQVAQAQKLVS